MDSLSVTDAASATVATHPRVSKADIEAAIVGETYITGDSLLQAANTFGKRPPAEAAALGLDVLTICILTMANGFTIVGKAAPASPENFNPELGRQFAYEDAFRQAWPLMGFSLRDRLLQQPELF